MTEKSFFFVVATVVGLLCGTGAHVLKGLIALVTGALTQGLAAHEFNWWLIVLPVAGMVITGIYTRYVLKDNMSHGTERIIGYLNADNPVLPAHLTYAPILASTITLGLGGSAGSEGPIAYTGAAIGSNIGRWCRLDRSMLMLMVGCGAGAGIAGIFKAPIAGVLFTLEVLKLPMTTMSVIGLVIACITASLTAYALSGCEFDITWLPTESFEPGLLGWMVALGLFCGLYSYYYSFTLKWLRAQLTKIKNPWALNVAAGLLIGVAIVLFPELYGEGYTTVGRVINNDTSWMMNFTGWQGGASPAALIAFTGGILLIKCFATSATNNGGGVAGSFAPTLFAGCIAGLFFALAANRLFDAGLDTATFALVGMGAVMAGAIRAPLMAIFITVEMVDAYSLFLPIVLAATLSYAVVKSLTPRDFYPARKVTPPHDAP